MVVLKIKQIALAFAFCLAAFFPTFAQDSAEPSIEIIITNQLEAFKKDDWETAFTFASPSIRTFFRTPENFGAMVRQGYPMVWRPRSVTYLEQLNVNGEIWQKVQIRDAMGQLHTLAYQMIMTDDGWRINGVQLLQESDLNA